MLSRCALHSAPRSLALQIHRRQSQRSLTAAITTDRSQTSYSRYYSGISAIDVAERTKRLLDAKAQSGITYDDLATKLGVTNTYAAQLLLGQAKLSKETAVKLQEALPTASQNDVDAMRRFDGEILKKANVHRTYEAITQYGESIKSIINEKCGDGIVSATNSHCNVGTTTGKHGEKRVVITFNGMFLPHIEQNTNRVLSESPHTKHHDVGWLENRLDDIIVPSSADERGRRGRAVYASAFTMMRVVRDFVDAAPNHEWVNSRDIGKHLEAVKIGDSNMLGELKQAHNHLRTFFRERACNLFQVKWRDRVFWVKVKGDPDETLLNEFKRTQFFTKEEKQFLESYKKENYIESKAFQHTAMLANGSDPTGNDVKEAIPDLDSLDGISSPALDYSQVTVVRLKDLCRGKGLPVSGTKDVLIERLENGRKLESEIIEKQRDNVREAMFMATKRPPRPKATENPGHLMSSAGDGNQPGNIIYSSTLPQMDPQSDGSSYRNPRSALPHMNATRYRNPRTSSTPADLAVPAHFETLVRNTLQHLVDQHDRKA